MKKYSELKLNRENLANVLPLDFPYALFMETTNICNFKCKMCPQSVPKYNIITGGRQSMSIFVANKVLRDLSDWGGRLKVIRLYGEGEPLSDKKIPDLIKTINANDLADRIEITTNGSLLSEDIMREISVPNLYLRVSIYGTDPDKHRSITQTRTSPASILEKVSMAYDFIQDQRRKGEGSLFLYVKMIDGEDPAENRAFLTNYSSICDEISLEPKMDWNSYLLSSSENQSGKIVCPIPFFSMMVKANGDVVVCCVDWNKATKLGNIKSQSLKEIWNGEALKSFRAMHLSGNRKNNVSCQNCNYLEIMPDNIDEARGDIKI